tara:strand:+ start:345 stop:2036 length:1692 start_codon:yes stop_codon:yes gene_type:complete
MSNPWAQSYEDLRRPYLEEKKAKKDYDGDGKVESGSKEHAGVVHNAIQRAKGGKADGNDTRKEEVETVDEKFSMAAKPEKREAPRPTRKAENKKGMSMKSRAVKAVGTQRRQDKETGITEDLAGMVDKATKAGQGALEKIGVKINRTPRPTARPSAQTSNTVRQNSMSNEETLEEKKKGLWDNIHAKRKRGEKPAKKGDKDYPKTLNVEGVRDPDPKKGTEERKARLEKKRGHKVDDHPQYKKEEMEHAEKVEFYGEVYTITNADVKGNTPAFRNYKSGMKSKIDGKPLYKLAPHVKLANSFEPEGDAIDEGSMKAARKNVGASTCWKGYKAKGTKEKNGRVVPNCVKEYSDWRQEMGEGFFSEAAKTEKLDIQTSGVKNKIEINPQLKTEGACSDKPMERLKTDRDGYRVPQKDADAAKARILAKTKKKRQQAKENIMKGALLPQSSDNSMLDSVEEQALQMIERTRYAKETGKDFKTGNKSEKGGTRDGKSAFDKVSREMRKTGGMMSSRGKAIQPQGKKKQPGKKGYKGVTPVDKIKGKLAQKKRNANHNPYKPRQGESD